MWYAMKASYGKALKAKENLKLLSIESFVPVYYKKVKIKGRNKIVPTAAIPNLIFVLADQIELEKAKGKIDYLHNMLVKSEGRADVLEPIIVDDRAMREFMQVVADAHEKVRYVDTALNKQIISEGTKVRVISGQYEGYQGVLCRPKGSRSKKVLIDLAGFAMVEMPIVDIELLEPIK